jgi:hypothetical protein
MQSNRTIMMLGAGIGLGVLFTSLYKTACRKTEKTRSDRTLNHALEETFPSSDPTATQDYAIPVNRM